MYRYLQEVIVGDLQEKMVFIGGPRQVGKTTFAKYIGDSVYDGQYDYLNWDFKEDRQRIMDVNFEYSAKLLIFDEIHKYPDWKNYLKGVYDKLKGDYHILVTGSARLNLFKKGGDSMLGRYYYYRLHPFSIAELQNLSDTELNFEALLNFGGFPEPYLKKNGRHLRRWQRDRVSLLVRDDVRDLSMIQSIAKLELLVDLLPDRVGSEFSYPSLVRDLQVSHPTVTNWIEILENFYYAYRIYPFVTNELRSLKKKPKLYLWDWSEIKRPGAKLENLVASHLLKWCHWQMDNYGYDYKLKYWRDRDGNEVDFVVVKNGKPVYAIEVKSSDVQIADNLKLFQSKFQPQYVVQVINSEENYDRLHKNIRCVDVTTFLREFSYD